MEFDRLNAPPLYRQVADHLKKRIAEGELREGEKLPPTAELAARYRVTLVTAQKSLKLLESQGLVERRRRTGTVVRSYAAANTVGILYPWGAATLYPRQFLERTAELAIERNFNIMVYFQISPRLNTRLSYELRDDAATGKLKVLLAPFAPNLNILNLEELGIPVLRAGAAGLDCWSRIGMGYLYGCGYRKIKLLSRIAELQTSTAREAFDAEYRGACEAAARFGVEFSRADHLCTGGGKVEFGYRAMINLFKSGEKFDAVFINHDILTPGAIMAIYASGREIPRDLGLLTHANAGETPLSPIPLSKLVYNPDGAIHALLDRAAQYLKLENCGNAGASPDDEIRLEPGGSCGENLKRKKRE